MKRTNRTVWRTATTNRDLLEYDADRKSIVVPVLEVSFDELIELHQATGQLILELQPPAPQPAAPRGAV